MGGQQAMGAGLFHQFLAQLRGGAVRGLPRIVFHGQDFFGDEAPDLGLQREQLGRESEVHVSMFLLFRRRLQASRPRGSMAANRFSITVCRIPVLAGS
ncbi:hypothetical protein D3C86_1777970 [compost metagenome]